MWIKLCGNTSLEDAQFAADAGADAVGFVFAPSPRQVTQAQVERITAKLASSVETYGVFVDTGFSQIAAAVEACRLTGVQLHGVDGRALRLRLQEHFAGLGRTLKLLPVLRWRAGGTTSHAHSPQSTLQDYHEDPSVDTILVDSFSEKAAGGTGTSFDWKQAQASLTGSSRLRIVIAGGLRPENVGQAISMLRPWGVDAVSGVEAAPGKKDHARVLAFIRAAREAEALANSAPADCMPVRLS